MLVLWLLLYGVFVDASSRQQKLIVSHEWRYYDYLWDSDNQKQLAIASGDYNHTKLVSIDVDQWHDKTFITIIRDDGVPSSLNTISGKVGPGGPLLKPYPDWSWTKKGDCNGITSVYRVAIDKCNRLWVLDTGKIGENKVCPAQLLAFDLVTDSLIKRIKIPDGIAMNSQNKGLLVTPIVETYGRQCQTTYVYMADVEGYGLVIYNGTNLWRLDSSIFAPDSKAENFTIQGESFTLADGVLGMALSPRKGPHRKLFFRSLASISMNNVGVTDLHKQLPNNYVRYKSYKNVLPSQAPAMAFSHDGILFYVLTTQTALTCWNSATPLNRQHMATVVQDSETLQFASGLKVIKTHSGDMILTTTNRLQKNYAGTMNYNEINFRILKGFVKPLVKNTKCDTRNFD